MSYLRKRAAAPSPTPDPVSPWTRLSIIRALSQVNYNPGRHLGREQGAPYRALNRRGISIWLAD